MRSRPTDARGRFAAYLFDWGDTLMVDLPGMHGPMADWPRVAAVDGAAEALAALSAVARLYVATGARDSDANDIARAFARVRLDRYLSGYFGPAELGVHKGTPGFFPAILDALALPADRVAAVGDDLERDIRPAAAAEITPYWLCARPPATLPAGTRVIASLRALCRVAEPEERDPP